MRNFLLIALLVCSGISAQTFTPIDTTSFDMRKILLEQYETEFDEMNRNIRKQYRSALRSEMLDIYEASQEEFLRTIQRKEYIFDERYSEYLLELTERIKQKLGPASPNEFKLLLSRSNQPNAFCMPGGTIVLNIGLFRFLSNEEQLLSVICHEIGHNELQHPAKGVLYKARISSSKSLKENVKHIAEEKRSQHDQAFAILKNILYTEGASRRTAEEEADSLGYTMFRKISDRPSEFINAMYFLKEFDSLPNIVFDASDYKRVFDLPEQAFDSTWLEMEDYSNYNYDFYKEKIDKDSIRSHPEMDRRISRLKNDFQELSSVESYTANSDSVSTYFGLHRLAQQEVMHNYFNSEEYGRGIYVTLARLKKDPDNSWLQRWLGVYFTQLYDAKKGYRLNKYVEHLKPEIKDKSYRQFLSFIWNLRLNELQAIAHHYRTVED